MNPRLAALEVLRRVILTGESLSKALPRVLSAISNSADRGLAQELAYGVCRWHLRLAPLVEGLLTRPLKRKDADVGLVIELGLYQILYQRTPDYAAVDAAVKTVRDARKPWAAALVNATLRAFLRQREIGAGAVESDPAVRLAFPAWMVRTLQEAYPHDWEAVCEASNARPPMTLRVNLARIGREDYACKLAEVGLEAVRVPGVESALVLTSPVDVGALPGFAEGLVSVQDAAAQLAAPLLQAEPGMRVLDACAAPGGKTAHLLERARGGLDLEAVEIDAERMRRIEETLGRLHLSARLVPADASKPDTWWNGVPYDRILLDAPCSATGVIRRHPDIKLHRSEADVQALVRTQRDLLKTLWPLLSPGGILVYATCSILPLENDANIDDFLKTHASARHLPIEAEWGDPRPYGRQILPGWSGMDGFYYARLEKR